MTLYDAFVRSTDIRGNGLGIKSGANKLVTAASSEPITLEEVKSALAVDFNDDNNFLQRLITSAVAEVELWLNRITINTTFDFAIDGLPNGDILRLPKAPLVSITSIKSYDEDNTESTFSSANYQVDTNSEPGRVFLNSGSSWPTGLRNYDSLVVRYVAGYGSSASDVPRAIRNAMIEVVAYRYEHRGDDPSKRKEVKALLNKSSAAAYRIYRI